MKERPIGMIHPASPVPRVRSSVTSFPAYFRYHPLYITDDKEGGYANKGAAERAKERVFAGVNMAAIGGALPTAGETSGGRWTN